MDARARRLRGDDDPPRPLRPVHAWLPGDRRGHRVSTLTLRRLPAPARPGVVNALGTAAGLGLGATVALGVSAESAGSLSAPGGLATAAGRLAGLLAAY